MAAKTILNENTQRGIRTPVTTLTTTAEYTDCLRVERSNHYKHASRLLQHARRLTLNVVDMYHDLESVKAYLFYDNST